jgi:NADPH:quinone reductase-like Zn-dependent oxidoreductase
LQTVPSVMKAALLKGPGGFEQLEYREDWPTPVPGDGEVLIRVGAASVNNTDINTRIAWYSKGVREGTTASGAASGLAEAKTSDSGWTGLPLAYPRVQGADACGCIVAVGGGVAASRIGERVLIEPLFRDPSGADPYRAIYFGSECDGAFAQYCKAPSVHAHEIESRLSDIELATFPCAYSAAENMLARARVSGKETVVVTGASGGVGSAAVQLARRRGAKVVALADASKAAAIHALGAARVLPRDADLVAELGSERVDAVIDVAGGPQFGALLAILRRGGRYAVAGAIAGPVVELDLRTVYLKDLELIGCTIFPPEVFANLLRYIERGEIAPIVAGVFPLRDIVAAQRAFLEKRHVGKIVLQP